MELKHFMPGGSMLKPEVLIVLYGIETHQQRKALQEAGKVLIVLYGIETS